MKSESIKELAAALAKAQAKIKGAVKDSANPFFKSSYADLQSVWDAIREPLSSNNLAVIQTTETNAAGQLELITTLAHSSGEWIDSRFPILAAKMDSQSVGSAVSYARRYSLASVVGVYQVDDDGEQAVARTAAPSRAAVARPQAQQAEATVSNKYTIAAPGTKVRLTSETQPQAEIAGIIDSELSKGTGSLGAPFDLVLSKGPHAGKQIQDLSGEEAVAALGWIEGELKALNRPASTLRGQGRDIYYALVEYVELKNQGSK
jgi:hypothetical protein